MINFRNLKIWDGVSEAYSEHNSICIDEGRIVSLGGDVGESRDMGGLTVLPGLIDAHVHMTLDPELKTVEAQLAQTDDELRTKMADRAEAMLRAGITTARDLGGGSWLELALRDRIREFEIPGPRLLCAGQPLTCPDGHCHFWGGVVRNKREINATIERQHDHGVDLIKMMATGGNYTKKSHPGRAQFSQRHMSNIVDKAREYDFSVAAHCHGTEGISRAVKAGVSTVEHCSWLDREGKRGDCDASTIKLMGESGTWVSPTINAGWARFGGGDGKFKAMVQENFRAMKKANVRFIASTDAGIPNVRHQDLPKALAVFAEYAELTPVETLRTATSNAAEALGIASTVGQLKPGYSADLLFVDGDPLTDLTALQKQVLVVARGRQYELETGGD